MVRQKLLANWFQTPLIIPKRGFGTLSHRLGWMLILIACAGTGAWSQSDYLHLRQADIITNSVGHGGRVEVEKIRVDEHKNQYLAGIVRFSADFDPGTDTFQVSNIGYDHLFIAKYDSLGNLVFAKTVHGNSACYVSDMDIDAQGNIYVVGSFVETIDFDPGPGVTELEEIANFGGNTNGYLAKYNSDGEFLYARRIGSVSYADVEGVQAHPAGGCYLVGRNGWHTLFDTGNGIDTLLGSNQATVFIARYADNGDFLFARDVNEGGNAYPNAIHRDDQGNIYIAGNFQGTIDLDPDTSEYEIESTGGSSDFFFAKYDSLGALDFGHGFGSNSSFEYGNDIATDASGNIYFTGMFRFTVDFDPDTQASADATVVTSTDCFVAKYDSSGDFIYVKQMAGNSGTSPKEIAVGPDNSLYVTGFFSYDSMFVDTGASMQWIDGIQSNDQFIVRFDLNGNFDEGWAVGGSGDDRGFTIDFAHDSTIYSAGYFSNSVDFDPGLGTFTLSTGVLGKNGFFTRQQHDGNHIWTGQIGRYTNDEYYDEATRIVADSLGNFIVAGYFEHDLKIDGPGSEALRTSNGQEDIFIAKYDSLGQLHFVKSIGSSGEDFCRDLSVDSVGNIILCGTFQNTIDLDPGQDTLLFSSQGSEDGFLMKLDPDGNLVYAFPIGGSSSDDAASLVVTDSQEVIVTGTFSGTVDFDPDTSSFNLSSSSGSEDIFVARYGPGGALIDAKRVGSSQSDKGFLLRRDKHSDMVLLCGEFSGSVQFGLGSGSALLTAQSSPDPFLLKMTDQLTFVDAGSLPSTDSDTYISDADFDSLGNVFICGIAAGTTDFDPGTGVSNIVLSSSWFDAFIAKYDDSLNLEFALDYGNTFSDYAHALVVDHDLGVWVTGTIYGSVDMDPGAGSDWISPIGLQDGYLAKYDSAGNYVKSYRFGSNGWDVCKDIDIDNDHRLYVSGLMNGTFDFDLESGVSRDFSINVWDAFYAVYGREPVYLDTSYVSLCTGDSILVNGTYLHTEGEYVNGYTAADGNDSLHITVIDLVPDYQLATFQESCYGSGDGYAVIQHLSSMSVSWSTGENGDSLTGIGAGDYYVLLNDTSIGCSVTDSFTLDTMPALSVVADSVLHVECKGDSSGYLEVSASGGTGSKGFVWSNGASSSVVSSLSANVYSVTVTDANGCTLLDSFQIQEPDSVVTALVGQALDPLCFDDTTGQLVASAVGGIAGYVYLWNTGLQGDSLMNLASGTYTVTVTDANGCTDSTAYVLQDPPQLSLNMTGVMPSCFGFSDGFAIVSGSGGSGVIDFTWSTSTTGDTLLHIGTGIYVVTATDTNNCTATDSVQVTQPDSFELLLNLQTPLLCEYQSSANLSATVTGGTPSYTYDWSTGSTDSTASGLGQGTYFVTVTDSNGCVVNDSAEIVAQSHLSVSQGTTQDPLCYQEASGIVSVTASNGVIPYSYSWSNGGSGVQQTVIAGSYTVTVTDGNGCTAIEFFALNDPPEMFLTLVEKQPALCFGQASGRAEVSATGGTPLLALLWPDQSTVTQHDSLLAGVHTVSCTDVNGCLQTLDISITEPSPLVISGEITHELCINGADGSLVSSVQGGTPPYTYNWVSISSTSNRLDHLGDGQYPLIVSDSNACTTTHTFIVLPGYQQAEPDFGADTLLSYSAPFELSTTTAFATYVWQDGSVESSIPVEQNGIYSVQVTDDFGCPGADSVFVLFIPFHGMDVVLFPNPSDGVVTLKSIVPFSQYASVSILDSRGKLVEVYSPYVMTTSFTLDLGHLSSGGYTLEVEDGLYKENLKLVLY